MHHKISSLCMLSLLAILPIAFASCTPVDNANSSSTASSADRKNEKLPITTSSEEARKEFLTGRDLFERLLIADSLSHFDKALSLDSDFALAHLARANASPSAKEFFEHLKMAVKHSDGASESERHLILAAEAGANGDVLKQKEHLDKVAAAHPNDERAHFGLGGYYFGQQNYDQAIVHYKKATTINPSYSPAYNILGYAYRQNGDYANAEQSFKKYIELIPNDPNPYDSYAELLLKMGKFDESIKQYDKALSIDSNFVASHFGAAADLMYMGKTDEASARLQRLMSSARNDGERRQALFGMMVLLADQGKLDQALQQLDKQYALGEKTNDDAAMSGDLQIKGDLLLEMGKYDEAKAAYEKMVKLVEDSNLSSEIKDNTRLFHHYNLAKVAIGKKDFTTAKAEAEEFRKGAAAKKNPALLRNANEIVGMIALAEKDYDKAIAELDQASQQNPYNLYRLCQAYEGKGDKTRTKEFCTKAAEFYSLPSMTYAFIRVKAEKMAGDKDT